MGLLRENLVFEIGTEELPSSCINEGIEGLKTILADRLAQNRINYSSIETYGTPRRLVAIVKGLNSIQEPTENLITGPPKKVAFDENNLPTRAATGFAKSLGIKIEELEEIETPKGVYVGKRIVEEGKNTIDILPDILKDTVLSLSFSKQMSWSYYDIKFARPIRWLLALYGKSPVRFSIENLQAGNTTYGHRTLHPQAITVKDADSYLGLVENEGKVIVDSKKRKKIILDSIRHLEKEVWSSNFKVVLDENLLDEVVNLIEVPNVLVGDFPEKFLYIPKDILIKAIEYHQKYFAVVDRSGNVSTKFIVIQNGIEDPKGEIIKGNQRVLRARLSDASFFYEEDRKHSFDYWLEKLKGVIFFSGLGNVYEKVFRLKSICLHIADLLENSSKLRRDNICGDLSRACMLCKCDLVTHMVVEFPELQGIVGREYAKEKGEKEEIAESIFEHYLPRFSGDILPSTDLGAILSIADKIDTICGMFLVGNIPSGSEDPFALRRKATGIVLSTLERKYDYDIDNLINYSLAQYLDSFDFKDVDRKKIKTEIYDFIIARYRFLLEKEDKRLDILEAILAIGCYSILDIDLRYKAIEDFLDKDDIEKIYTPMVRCKNIVKGKNFSSVSADILTEEYEKKLFLAVESKRKTLQDLVGRKGYYQALLELKDLNDIVNAFFDNVLVMDEDEKVRQNRINLVKTVIDLYLSVADFSKLFLFSY